MRSDLHGICKTKRNSNISVLYITCKWGHSPAKEKEKTTSTSLTNCRINFPIRAGRSISACGATLFGAHDLVFRRMIYGVRFSGTCFRLMSRRPKCSLNAFFFAFSFRLPLNRNQRKINGKSIACMMVFNPNKCWRVFQVDGGAWSAWSAWFKCWPKSVSMDHVSEIAPRR